MTARRRIGYGLFLILCVGCGAGTAYQQNSWIHQNIESDWDLDSAVCLERSDMFTEEDEQAIEDIRQSAQGVKGSAAELATITQYEGSGFARGIAVAAVALSGAMSFYSSYDEQTAEEQVRENKFSSCMTEKGWQQPGP